MNVPATPVSMVQPVWITSTATFVSVHLGTQTNSVRQVNMIFLWQFQMSI